MNQTKTEESPRHETIEVESIGTEQEWPSHNLKMLRIAHDGIDTGRRFVIKNGEYVADVSSRYRLLPNDVAEEAMDEVAHRIGANVLKEYRSDTVLYKMFTLGNVESIRTGDSVELGFVGANSIDGTTSFRIMALTYRDSCSNQSWMGIRGISGEEVLHKTTHRHTGNITEDALNELQKIVQDVGEYGYRILEGYRKLAERQLRVDEAVELKNRLPDKYVPEFLHELDLPEDRELTRGEKAILATEMPRVNAWDAYNDVTEKVTHSTTLNPVTREQRFNQLHRAIKVVQ